jgi:hypothetical protein
MYRSVFKVFLIGALSAAAMLAIRYLVIEPDAVAQACLAYSVGLQCKLRDAAIYGFSRQLYGPISLAAAVLGAIGALRPFAILAMMTGMAGVVLYDFDLSAVGLLLGALLYLRLNYRGQVRDGKQHAQTAP